MGRLQEFHKQAQIYLDLLLENSVFHIEKSNKNKLTIITTTTDTCTLIKRSVASLSGPGLLVEILNFLFYKTLRGLGLPLMVKVFVVLSVNFSEIHQILPVGFPDF